VDTIYASWPDYRDLTDEEAFRLADIKNRDREDISDFERARRWVVKDEFHGKLKLHAITYNQDYVK